MNKCASHLDHGIHKTGLNWKLSGLTLEGGSSVKRLVVFVCKLHDVIGTEPLDAVMCHQSKTQEAQDAALRGA